jgi:hypothetical protein
VPAFDVVGPPVPDTTDCGLWFDPLDLPCLEEPTSGEAPIEAVESVAIASSILWALSGRQLGPTCPPPLRPCHRDWCEEWGRTSRLLSRWATPATVWPCGSLGRDLDLAALAPIYDIVEVLIDGAVFTAWRLDERRLLRRTDGLRWPTHQDLSAPATEVDTWQVRYRGGLPLDMAAVQQAKVYACELYKARIGQKCRLPKRTRQVVRQAVTVELIDPMEYLDAGRTGIPEIDLWLRAVNPAGLAQRSSAMSVDRRPPRSTGQVGP